MKKCYSLYYQKISQGSLCSEMCSLCKSSLDVIVNCRCSRFPLKFETTEFKGCENNSLHRMPHDSIQSIKFERHGYLFDVHIKNTWVVM